MGPAVAVVVDVAVGWHRTAVVVVAVARPAVAAAGCTHTETVDLLAVVAAVEGSTGLVRPVDE